MKTITSLILQFEYFGLFMVSFLAATLLPLGSEAAVGMTALLNFNPYLVITIATAGNFLGALINYWMGKWGGNFVFTRFIKTDSQLLSRAERIFFRRGAPILFFAWVPIIGDPLTMVAGAFNVRLLTFSFWVILGKMLRYVFVLKGVQIIFS